MSYYGTMLFRYLIKVTVLFLVYFVAARFGLYFDAVSGFATLVWPPTGIALAVLLLFGRNLWPGIFFGAFLVNWLVGAPMPMAFGIGVGNTLEALVGFTLLSHIGFHNSLDRLRDSFSFIFLACLGSTLVSASIGVGSLLLGNVISLAAVWETWAAWWIGDILGSLVIAPLVLTLFTRIKGLTFTRYRELTLAFGAQIFLTAASSVIVGRYESAGAYLILPPLVWIAVRFSPRITFIAVALTSALTILGAVEGFGPFPNITLVGRLFSLQLFMIVMSGTALIFSGLAAERRRIEEGFRLANEKLGESEEKLRMTIDFMPIGIAVVYPPHGKIEILNKEAKKLLGRGIDLSASIESYASAYHIFTESGAPYPLEEMPTVMTLRTKQPATKNDLVIERPDGSRITIEARSAPLFNREGNLELVYTVFDDITRKKEVERARMDFVRLVSHQLRTPLSGAKWLIETMQQGVAGALSPQQKDYLREIYDTNERMIKLIGDMLSVLRIESGDMPLIVTRVSTPSFIKDFLSAMTPVANAREIEMQDITAPLVFKIYTDGEVLRIILESLMTNAINYSSPGKEVTIEVKKKGHDVIFVVKDTGIGIPAAESSRIFERFYRASNAKLFKPDGTGLGLSIALMLAEKIHARISFESKENKGSTFILTIPGDSAA